MDLFTVGVNGTEVSIYVKENFADALQLEKKHLTRKMLRVCQNKETPQTKTFSNIFQKYHIPCMLIFMSIHFLCYNLEKMLIARNPKKNTTRNLKKTPTYEEVYIIII